MHRFLSLTPLVALALAGCGDALTPADFVGTYTLRTVEGDRLPVTVPALRDGCSVRFEYGTLLLGDGAFMLYLTWVSGICPGVDAVVHTHEPFGGGLTTHGRSLTLRGINPGGPPNAIIEATVTFSDRHDVILTFPAGAFGSAEPAVWVFGFYPALMSGSDAG